MFNICLIFGRHSKTVPYVKSKHNTSVKNDVECLTKSFMPGNTKYVISDISGSTIISNGLNKKIDAFYKKSESLEEEKWPVRSFQAKNC